MFVRDCSQRISSTKIMHNFLLCFIGLCFTFIFLILSTIRLACAAQNVGHNRLFYWEVRMSKYKADILPPSSPSKIKFTVALPPLPLKPLLHGAVVSTNTILPSIRCSVNTLYLVISTEVCSFWCMTYSGFVDGYPCCRINC